MPERSLQVRIERTGCRGLVGLLVRAEYLPYGVSGWTALAEAVADTLSSLAREGRNGNQDKNCENVFDHQPADCDIPVASASRRKK